MLLSVRDVSFCLRGRHLSVVKMRKHELCINLTTALFLKKKNFFGRIKLYLLIAALPSRKLLLPIAAGLCGGGARRLSVTGSPRSQSVPVLFTSIRGIYSVSV